ncbi:MAG: hypothetical protein COB76_01485 [Alphaproteobacteria bacterium]|nr:MAG: hypothetical protein COB76_01485 [Alphaproteobacteria bacterium]
MITRNRELVEKYKSFDADVLKDKSYQIGEIIICNFPHNDGTSKHRPTLIWGQYFDKHNKLIGFDVLQLTTLGHLTHGATRWKN